MSTEVEKSSESVHAIALPVVLASVITGSCTTADWLSPEVDLLLTPWLGSAMLTLVGLSGLIYLAFSGVRPRGWLVAVFGLLLDWLLTALLLLPAQDYDAASPFGFWPYVLGTVATFLAGAAVGFMLFFAPFRFGFAIVFLDCLIAGLFGFLSPQSLSLRLISRVAAAFGAAGLGAIVGSNLFLTLRDRSLLGRSITTLMGQIAVAGIGGVVTALFMKYVGFTN
jgi:hypothetical protein